MSDQQTIPTYLKQIEHVYASGRATEHSYRAALKSLLMTTEEGLTVINEPKRIEVGAPDYIVERNTIPIGFVEAKDVVVNLDRLDRRSQKQLASYRAALPNLILTNYLEFRWFVGGDEIDRAYIGEYQRQKIKPTPDGFDSVASILRRFTQTTTLSIKSPRELAQKMAAMAREIAYLINKSLTGGDPSHSLQAQMQAFEKTLIPHLTVQEFADMYAQTLAYGLFAARVSYTGKNGAFSWKNAFWNIPKTNPFLRKMFQEIASDMDDRVVWLVETLSSLLAHADMDAILVDFGRSTRQEDPVVHFYETFLATYNPEERERRGVYYTPEPVVSYIVRSVDHLLKERFDRPTGLADTNTMILDPATGTGTFLYFVIREIYEALEGQRGTWDTYVRKHLLPRVFGFELLMAPYAVAHMKLGVELREMGYKFRAEGRLGVYLTNTLEETARSSEVLFAQFIAEEAEAAAEIKRDKPIMVILGNPPYANFGQMNRGEWITNLMRDWKPADEKKWNPDDYMKFVRFAQWRIERTGQGILAFITNHSFLDGVTHRRMRETLMETFSDVFILDLHGNKNTREIAPDGSRDDNVFDIRQGVSINIFVKEPESRGMARVHHFDLWGRRQAKYDWLNQANVANTDWATLTNVEQESCLGKFYFFTPTGFEHIEEYCKYRSVQDIFPLGKNGLKTDRDDLFFAFDRDVLEQRMKVFYSPQGLDSDFVEQYNVRDSSSYPLLSRRSNTIFSQQNIRRCLYRPFDVRHLYYDPALTSRPAWDVMQHMVQGHNLGLITSRQTRDEWWVFATDVLAGHKSLAAYDINSVFPLYLYPEKREGELFHIDDDGSTWPLSARGRRPNLHPVFVKETAARIGLAFTPEGNGDLVENFSPEDLFHYAYAVFHSPAYRERYAELLKIAFPRLPLPSDVDMFRTLCEKGAALVDLHLLRGVEPSGTKYPVSGDQRVEQGYPKYTENGRVCINKTQYFEGVAPEVWDFHVGGYQVLHQWLKDRRGQTLSFEDITHYQRVVVALRGTMQLMAEVDEAIPGWPIE